jgi:alcohol dehydrogenase
MVDTVSTPILLKILAAKRIDPARLITHHFKLTDILEAYETFAHAADTRALKVIIEAQDRAAKTADHVARQLSGSRLPSRGLRN